LGAPKRSAKHKIAAAAKSRASIAASRLCGREVEENFSFVNVSRRRLLLRRGGFEGARNSRSRGTLLEE
jgi:hypothetical protein